MPRTRGASIRTDASAVLTALKRAASAQFREDMGTRYGIHTKKAFGVKMSAMLRIAKSLGTDHALAAALWDTGWYEARMVACMIDDPALVTSAQMDRWCRDFDNWGICDTVCFKLFDRTPHAFAKIPKWARRRDEFIKRAGFALLACVALHDKKTGDAPFLKCLPLIEGAADDDRNFVKKGVSWALRAVGGRSPALTTAARPVIKRLLASPHASARGIGREAQKALK